MRKKNDRKFLKDPVCVAKMKNEQIALPGDYFQRMGLGLRASRRMASGEATRSFESGIAMRTWLFVARKKVNGRV